ncbi:MAG: AAA family ATPase, partial [Candidatus Omnitrophica bacterium]|nr:AAA family ATPase [Candidatus Omnitrophota bacterium]
MFKTGKKSKIILRIISIILIQAFLFMDVAWCGGTQLLNDITPHKTSTLAPKIYINAQNFQQTFNNFSRQIFANIPVVKQIQYFSNPNPEPNNTLLSKIDLTTNTALKINTAKNRLQGLSKVVKKIDSNLNRVLNYSSFILKSLAATAKFFISMFLRFFKLGFNIPYELGNIASGNWTESQHYDLNQIIKNLIDDADHNLSDNYDHKQLKDDIRNIVNTFDKLPPKLKDELTYRLQATNPEYTLDSLVKDFNSLLDNPNLNLFFLKPKFNEDKFSFLYKDEHGTEIPLHARAHFGHNQTKGKDKEQNCYIAAPFFDSCTNGEKLALIVHELTHLLLGKGDQVHSIAEQIQFAFIRQYDTKADIPKIQKGLVEYIELKEKITHAVSQDDREKAESLYKRWIEVTENLDISDVSVHSISSLIFMSLQKQIAPVLGQIITNLKLAGGDANQRGIIIGSILEDVGITGPLARLIFDIINSMPFSVDSIEYDLENSLLAVSSRLATEIKRVANPEFSQDMNSLIEEVVDEVVGALYEDKVEKEYWRKKILNDVVPNRIDMHIPEHLFRKDLFSENKDLLLATLYTFNHSVCGYGAYSGNFKKLYLSSEINFSEIRSTFKHELIHYLADYKQIKIDINWEFTTYAIDLTDKIMYSKAGDIETAERDMALYIHEYGSGLKELYNRGKELGENDEATYILKPHEVEDTAGYFSIDLLVIEAIKVYQAKGIPTKELRRYLTYKTKANRTIFEEQQFYRDQYAAQRVAGIIMAGIFMAEYEKSGIHPVTSLRNYFHELDQIFGKPSEADQLWIDNTLIPELETLAQQLYGKKTRLEKADVTDKLGLWIFDEVSKWQATIKYWPFTLYPRQRQDKDRKLHQQLARERSIGNLLLSIYRFRYGKDEKLQKQQAELFDNPAFSCLWDTLLIPRAVFQGVPTVQKKINRIVADGEIKQGLQVPELIQKVFHDKYNLGNAQAEQDLFSAYPLHIQYIDSVLYQWSQHKQDPRVKPGSEVSIAVTKTFNAWSKIMFNADQFRNYEDIFELIMQEIWPEYKKLFEQDVEDEKNRNLIEQMEKEELVEPGLMDPDGLSAQQQKMLEDFFNALPQDIQDQIIGQAMQMMNAVSACSGQGSASDMPDAAGQSGKFSSGQMPSQAQPQASASSIEQSIEAVESLIGQVEKMLEGITKQADNIGDEAQSISDQIPTSPGKLSEHGKDKAEQISNMAHELQNSTATLGQLTDQMQQGTGDIKDKSFDLQDSAPPVESATSTAQAATDLDDNTQKLQDKIKQLQDKVNELVKTADRLKDFMQTSDDPSQIDQVGKAVQKDSDEVGKSSQEISSSTQTIQNSLQSLQDQIKSLTQQIKEYEQGISEYKETAKAQQEVDDTQTPSETSVPQDQAGTQAQTGDAQSAQDSIPTTSQQAGDQARKESNQMPSDQPMAEVSSLPDGPTALKQILDNAKQLTDSDEMVDRHEDEEFTTVVDEAWLEALKKKELLAEMQRTGLNKAELKEYKEWRELLSEDLIDNMTDLFRGFIVPQLDVEKIRKKYSGILKKPIKGILGGLPFIKRQEATPLPVKITLLIDVSSSMRGNRILWAKLTMMLLLEVIFAIKDELESLGYPDNLVIIEFELGSFNHGTSLFISHDTSSEIGEDRKERLIYDAIKKLEATGCTDEKKALGEFTTRLIESEDPAGFEDKARRILIAIGDGDVDSIAKDDIRQVIEYALENEIEIFGVSVGDDSSRQSVLDAFSRERAVLPQEQDLSDLPLLVMQKFAECLKPPGADIPWETIINSVFGIFGFGSIFNSYLKPLLNFFNKETEQDKNTAKEEPLRNTEYRHFFYQTIDGKDYLVWRKKDKKGDIQQLKWQRGAGGLYTPELVTVDDDDNEQKILDILQSVYLQEAEYASYSQDGKLYLRYGSKGEVLLMEKDREGSWQKKKEFLPKTQSTNFKEQGSYRIYDQGDLRWRIDSLENIDIELGKDVWFSVVGASKFSQNLYIEYDEATGMYVIFDSVNSRVVIAKKNDKYLDTIYDLAIGNLKPQLEPEGKLIRLIGSQGLGKDVLIRAAAHLANEEVYFVAGNNDMEPEDFREYQTIGLEEEAGTGHLYTATNHVQHNGGWVVYDEWNKIKPKVRSTLKTQIAAKTHQRWVEENAKEKLSTFKNHERARFFATANYDEEGIVSSGISDQALQERYANIRFVWRDPASEKGLQYKLALDEIKKLRPELANNELNEEKQRIREIIDMLVDISWPMRLSYAGYDSTQQQELVKDDFKNWTRLLTDDAFMPATKPGKNLRRAPSPRVLANIIRHAVMYPKTWQHTAWSVVELWFNFYADGMKPQDRARQFKAIKQQFEFPVHTAGSNGIKNEDDLPPLILKESYFKVEDEYLIVTPEKIDGQNSEYWDKIKIWIHPEAREYIKQYGLPEDMRYWLSIGNVSNSWLLYWSLQARSLGKSVILVGEQGTGKSFLSQAIAQLISGPEIEMIEITPDTDKEALTFQAYIRKGKSGYDFGPVARSIAKKKTCVLEESTQGSPGVMGTLNEAIERHFMNMPNGHKLGEEGDGRFGVIHAVNTPGSSAFHVKAFSAEFIERHAVLHVPQLPLQDMKDFIISLATYNNTLVNPRVIGERRLDVASGEIQKLANTDEDKWDGLLGAIQWIRYQKSQNPQDKNLLPRVPGMRTLKNMIKELKSYWQTKAAFYDGDMQQLFLDFFNKHFVLEGSLKQKAAWAHEIKDAFTQARLWSDKEDGLEKYLAGEDMIVQKLPLLRKPDTGEYQLDKILVYLQENTQGVGVAVHIEQLRKLVTDIALASKDWEVLSFSQRLKHMYKLKDIYQILGLIFEHRQGRGYTAHTDENITMMKDIQEGIVQAHALRENWPPSFFEQEGNYEDLEKAWQGEQEEVLSVGSLEIDDILGKIAVNFEDTEYKKEQIVKLKKIIEEKIPGLKNKYLHEIVLQLSLLMAMRGDVYDILKHQAQKEPVKELAGYVDDVINSSSFPLEAQKAVVFPAEYLECFEKAGMKNITPHEAAKRIEEILAAEEKHAKIMEVFKQYPALFQKLYSWMVLMATVPGLVANEREEFVNSAKIIYALWQRITKSFEQAPDVKDKDRDTEMPAVEKRVLFKNMAMENEKKLEVKSSDGRKMFLLHVKQGDKPNIYYIDKDGRGRFLFDEPPDEIVGKTLTKEGYGYIETKTGGKFGIYYVRPDKDKAIEIVTGAKGEFSDWELKDNGYGLVPATLADGYSIYYVQPGKDNALEVVKGAESILASYIAESGYGFIEAKLADGWSFYYLQTGEEPIEVVKGAKTILGRKTTERGYGYTNAELVDGWSVYYVQPGEEPIEVIKGAKSISHNDITESGYGYIKAELADGYSLYYLQPGKEPIEVVKGVENTFDQVITESGCGFIEAKLADSWSFYYLQPGEEPIEVGKGAKNVPDWKITERGYGYIKAKLADGWSFYYLQPGEELIEVVKGAKSIPHNDITESGYGYIMADLSDGWSVYCLQPGKDKALKAVKGAKKEPAVKITKSGYGYIAAELADSWSVYYLQPGKDKVLKVVKGAKSILGRNITENGYGYIKAELTDGLSFYYLQPGEEPIEVVKGAKDIPVWKMAESGYGCIEAEFDEGYSVYYLQPGKDNALEVVKGEENIYDCKITESGYGYIETEFDEGYSIYYLQPGKDQALEVVTGAKEISGREITERGYGYIKAELADGWGVYYVQPGKDQALEVVRGAKRIPDLE